MKNLLTKKEILLIEQLNENVVPWNKSALGILSNAALRPFSWLSGSIKKNLKKQQINNLVRQYGLEIVKAIHKVDTDIEIDDTLETEPDTVDTKEKPIDNSTIADAPKYLEKYKKELNTLTSIKPEVKKFLNLENKDLKNTEYINMRSIIVPIVNSIDIKGFKIFLDNNDIPGTENYEKVIQNFVNNAGIILKHDNVRDFFNEYQSVAGGVSMLKTFIKNLSDLEDLYDLTILELELQINPEEINESTGYKLPKNITSIFSQDTLNKIENIPNIKKKMDSAINKVRLNTIAYEANYIIDNSDKQKAELQHLWEVGIQNIRDYFQNIIDPNTLPIKPTGTIDNRVKENIKTDQKQLSELQKLDIVDTFPVGEDFDKEKVYALECVITGQNNKNLRTILLVTPVDSFTESITDNKFRYFKMFGGYEYDKSIKRINIFKSLTNNKELINGFEKDTSTYYFAIQNLKPASKPVTMFLYSNSGKMFFNNTETDVDQISDILKKQKGNTLDTSLKNIEKIGNTVKILINQRFVVKDENIKSNKYPNISPEDVLNDTNSKRAVSNHKKLLNILS